MPVRNRYKVFIIDEVHQLSTPSFNALLKSIEEPPPHVVFMMATTELDKIPETVLSRSQVYEFRTISTKAIADQLRTIVDAEGIDGRRRVAAADRARRRRQHARRAEQARSGDRVHRQDDRRRRRGDGARAGRPRPAARHAAGGGRRGRAGGVRARRRARSRWATTCALVCRELSRVVRDLLVLSVDPSRIDDPEIAGEGERDRLKALAGALLARGSAARVRSADARRSRHPQRRAAALSPRDGAAAVDPPAQAGADRGSDRGRRSGAASSRLAGRRHAADRARRSPPPPAPVRAAAASRRARLASASRRRRPRRRWPRSRAPAPASPRPRPPSAAGAERRRRPRRQPATSRTRCSPRSARRRRCSTTWSSRRRRRSRSPAIA